MTLSDREILELNELCDAAIEGTLTSAQRVRFEQLLTDSEAARQYYVQASDLSASLVHYAGEMQIEAADAPRPLGRPFNSRFFKSLLVAAALALAFAAWPSRQRVGDDNGLHHPEYVARLTAAKNPAWEDDAEGLSGGDFLRRGQRLKLASGIVELTFDSGAVVTLQGPALFDVNSAWDSTLRRGALKAHVPSQALGFRIANPAVEVVDLGTEFSMVADSEGFADVFVLDGEVEAMPRGNEDSEAIRMHANESRRFALSGSSGLEEQNQIIQQFDADVALDRARKPAGFVYWSLDQLQGRFAPATELRGLTGSSFALRVTARSSPQRRSLFVEGYRNGGLRFEEASSVQVNFPGLSSNFPRTIAFWVKVPENAPLSNAYSMVAWQGDSEKLGGRPVHIGWNRNPQEGPLGAIRTDFSGGHAMGTTPLRDNRWHFVTVIFLPGDDPVSPVQVKQYVDGRLESNTVTPGTKRSIRGHSNLANKSSLKDQLWLGRRLGAGGPRQEHFLGELDELVIVDRGLEPAELVELMDGRISAIR
jgi:hypothetical protein